MKKNYFFDNINYAIKNFENIFFASKLDYSLRFRRTKLGIFWNILTIILTVSMISLIWSTIFDINFKIYLPNLLFGMTIYNFLAGNIVSSSELVSSKYSEEIQSLETPLSFYIFRHLLSSVFDYLSYFVVFVPILFFLVDNFNYNMFLLFPAYILIILNIIWISFLLSFLGSRFRDIQPLLKTLLGVGMMLTPVLWDKNLLGEYQYFAYLNPLTFFIESVKYPFLGENPGYIPFLGLLLIGILGIVFTAKITNQFYKKLPYWAN